MASADCRILVIGRALCVILIRKTAKGLEPVSNLVDPPIDKHGALEDPAFVDDLPIFNWVDFAEFMHRATIQKPLLVSFSHIYPPVIKHGVLENGPLISDFP